MPKEKRKGKWEDRFHFFAQGLAFSFLYLERYLY